MRYIIQVGYLIAIAYVRLRLMGMVIATTSTRVRPSLSIHRKQNHLEVNFLPLVLGQLWLSMVRLILRVSSWLTTAADFTSAAYSAHQLILSTVVNWGFV